jgi:DNA-binding MarR family transcriptional regulator
VPRDEELTFADHVGRYYATQHGFPPMVGRLLGYLLVCDPPHQTLDELGDALMASRSAIAGAVKLLESYHYVQRVRTAGERADRVHLDPTGLEPWKFDSQMFAIQAALFREGLALIDDAAPSRRALLAELAAAADFFGERLPQVLAEWRTHRDTLRAAGTLSTTD